MVAEWKEFLWDVPEERIALWSHCQTLFLRYSFPALQVCFFYCQVTSDMIYCSFVSPNFQVISILLPVDRTFIFLFLFFFLVVVVREGYRDLAKVPAQLLRQYSYWSLRNVLLVCL